MFSCVELNVENVILVRYQPFLLLKFKQNLKLK